MLCLNAAAWPSVHVEWVFPALHCRYLTFALCLTAGEIYNMFSPSLFFLFPSVHFVVMASGPCEDPLGVKPPEATLPGRCGRVAETKTTNTCPLQSPSHSTLSDTAALWGKHFVIYCMPRGSKAQPESSSLPENLMKEKQEYTHGTTHGVYRCSVLTIRARHRDVFTLLKLFFFV